MLDYIKRRRRLLISAAAGVAGAAAVYYWWRQDEAGREDATNQQACLGADGQSQTVQAAKQAANNDDDDDEVEQDLDNSMAHHFQYIQGEAAPDQLEQLLPRVQAILYQMTDVQTALASMPPGSPVLSKLLVMAQHSLARPLAAVWLIPLTDLLVRAKLNFIGRHIFLEEKLLKLRQPTVRAAHGMRGWGSNGLCSLPPRLPPRIHGNAMEAFLLCNYLENVGCPWLVSQVLHVVGASLSDVDLEAARGPEDLEALLQSLYDNTRDALTLSLTGWAQLLLGDTATPGPHQAHDARQMGTGVLGPPGALLQPPSRLLNDPQVAAVEAELQRDLRLAICGAPFAEAADAAVQHTLRSMLANVQQLFPHGPVPPVAPSDRGLDGSGSGGGAASGSATSPQGKGSWTDAVGGGRVRSWGGSIRRTGSAVFSSVAWALGRSVSSTAAAGNIMSMAGAGSLHDLVYAKPARPMPRLLKPTQQACDPLFANAHQLSRATASLGPVLAFSASIFAKPVNELPLELSNGYSQY